jgi:hypothetical protein
MAFIACPQLASKTVKSAVAGPEREDVIATVEVHVRHLQARDAGEAGDVT